MNLPAGPVKRIAVSQHWLARARCDHNHDAAVIVVECGGEVTRCRGVVLRDGSSLRQNLAGEPPHVWLETTGEIEMEL